MTQDFMDNLILADQVENLSGWIKLTSISAISYVLTICAYYCIGFQHLMRKIFRTSTRNSSSTTSISSLCHSPTEFGAHFGLVNRREELWSPIKGQVSFNPLLNTTQFSQKQKNLKKPYPLIMHAFCHLDAQTKILRSNFSISTR